MASAKQRAWRKKFAAMARSGRIHKRSGSRRKAHRKTYKRPKSINTTMARRGRKSYRRYGRSIRSGLGKITPFLTGFGAADIADDITERIAPQWSSIARPAAAYLATKNPLVALAVFGKDYILGQKILAGSPASATTGDAI